MTGSYDTLQIQDGCCFD